MMRRSGHGRTGFTLVEMLVVIAIIVVLISLLLPAVMKVSDAGQRAENRARMLAVNTALNAMKGNSAFGSVKYIPAGNHETKGPFRLRNQYPASSTDPNVPNINSFEARYLIAMFNIQILDPTVGIADLGYPGLSADLDANQTLVFFLGGIPEAAADGTAVFPGFSTNSQKPFTKRVSPDEPRKTTNIDLGGGGKPKYALSKPAPGGNVDFARLLDPYGTPYAYFAAYGGLANKYFGHNADPGFGGVQAYHTGDPTSTPYENASGYQIISAGKDQVFGATGNMKDIRREGEDDVTNIIEKQLGSQQ